jgi:hypothetical protein
MTAGSTMKTAGGPEVRFIVALLPTDGPVAVLSLQDTSSGRAVSANRQRPRDPASDRELIILR